MRRNMSKVISVVLTMSLALSMCACSAKSSADTENTTAEAETEIETEEETEEETVDASGNDPSGNDVSDNDVSENEAEEETEDKTESKPNAASESEEEIEEESTNSKTSEKDSTKSETTTSETTTEAVTVQSVSAVVNGTHYVGETLTGADFTVTVKMSDGETLTNPAGWSAQPLTLNSTSNLITVAYEGASVTITVNAENVPETTTAANVASNTTTTTTTKAETTQAAATQATTAATTAATTQAETTTAAPTTTAAETTTASDVEWVEWADGDYNYALAQALFIAQNEMRAEAGVDPLTWDDQIYEVAKQCAKVCGDNGVIDHKLTVYRSPAYRVAYTGETIEVGYSENLQSSGASNLKTDDVSWYSSTASGLMKAIKNSSAHYKTAIGDGLQYGAIAVYKMGDRMYISYLFYDNDDFWIGESFIW